MDGKKTFWITFVMVIMVVSAIFGGSLMSTIGDIELSGASCTIPSDGGECDIYLKMPQDTELELGYSFDIIPNSVYDEDQNETYYATNLKVSIGDVRVVEYPGESTERIYLPDMSYKINNYCDRDGTIEGKECIIPLRFNSDEGTEIVIVSELGALTSYGFSDEVETNISLNFKEKPVSASITLGVILLLVSIIGFVIYRKIKK